MSLLTTTRPTESGPLLDLTQQATVAYWEKPDQVVWVQTPVRQLRGACYYFVAKDSYGAWFDPAHDHDYAGPGVAYRWDGINETQIDFEIPDDAVVYEGFLLTDEQARFVGLI